jgi:hypothetical protein
MSQETPIIRRILAEHGARPDLRLWRNETAGAWVGRVVGRTREGHVVLQGARQIQAGLCVGSSDLIGIGPGGQFLALEVKSERDRVRPAQRTFLERVAILGGLAEVVRSPEDVARVLGRRAA